MQIEIDKERKLVDIKAEIFGDHIALSYDDLMELINQLKKEGKK